MVLDKQFSSKVQEKKSFSQALIHRSQTQGSIIEPFQKPENISPTVHSAFPNC